MRTVVSVSMSPEVVTRLKETAAERGQSFSARVCELVEAGERVEQGIFTQTDEGGVDGPGSEEADGQIPAPPAGVRSRRGRERRKQSDDGGSVQTPDGEKSGAAQRAADEESAPESSLPADSPGVIESGNEDQPDSRRVLSGTTTERVYGAVKTTRRSVAEVAEEAGVSEVEAGEILERLIDKDEEPIVLRSEAGVWVCWLSS